VDKSLWTGDCRQPGDLAATPPLGPRGGGAAVAVLDTHLPTLLKKKFFNFVKK
jgi:hypothetical protein